MPLGWIQVEFSGVVLCLQCHAQNSNDTILLCNASCSDADWITCMMYRHYTASKNLVFSCRPRVTLYTFGYRGVVDGGICSTPQFALWRSSIICYVMRHEWRSRVWSLRKRQNAAQTSCLRTVTVGHLNPVVLDGYLAFPHPPLPFHPVISSTHRT